MDNNRRGTYRQCATCSKEFYVYPSGDKHDAHRYCSYQCWLDDPNRKAKYRQGERETRTCERCGKQYERLKSDPKGKRFCSQECAYASRKGPLSSRYNPDSHVTRVCPVCKQRFQRPRAWMAKPHQTNYCSRACQAKDRALLYIGENAANWRGGYDPYYGPNWRAQRRKARHRDGYTCRHCGKSEAELGRQLDVHHIRPFREFKGDWRAANQLSNLTSLCACCHKAIEWKT